jgi:hypothetical protein
MGENIDANKPLLRSSAEIHISATPKEIYSVISDLPRSGEWSPECQGGEWITGEPATTGAVFQGHNLRHPDVVAWAPVVRGTWTTHAEVVAAEADRTFRWAMHDSSGRKQDSVWAFEIEPADGGSVLVHHFRMGTPTEGIRGITSEMDGTEKQRFFDEWGDKVAGDLAVTLERIKVVVENQ